MLQRCVDVWGIAEHAAVLVHVLRPERADLKTLTNGEESAMEPRTRRPIAARLLAVAIVGIAGLSHGPGFAGSRERSTWTIDALLASTATRIASFGGFWVDESANETHVWTTNGSMRDARAAKILLAPALGDTELMSARVVTHRGRYSFAQLHDWHTRTTAGVLELRGAVSTDVDDRRNRISIGVEDLGAAPAIRSYLRGMRVPLEAIEIERVVPEREMGSLQATLRPLAGGTQISGAGKTCSLGFTATRGSVSGLVTNSHCTATRTGSSGSSFYQANSTTANRVGTESVDPPLFVRGSKPCPEGRSCRYSDAAFITFSSGVSFVRGRVARPSKTGTIEWDQSGAYRIVGEESPVVGRTLAKIGRTTGRTEAAVSKSCMNVSVSNTNITMLCQAHASFGAQPGDSGSTVLRLTNSPAANDARLNGILWGSQTFSPIANIQYSDTELGPLTPCASGFSC